MHFRKFAFEFFVRTFSSQSLRVFSEPVRLDIGGPTVESDQQHRLSTQMIREIDRLISRIRSLMDHIRVRAQSFPIARFNPANAVRRRRRLVLGPALTRELLAYVVNPIRPPLRVAGVQMLRERRHPVVVVDDYCLDLRAFDFFDVFKAERGTARDNTP